MTAKITNLYREAFAGLSRDIWLLTLVTLVNRSGTMVVPFIAVYLTQELGFSYIESGIVMSFFGVGSVVGTYIGGWLTDTFGYFRTMFWSLFLAGFALLNLLWLEDFYMWCAGVFLVTAIGDCFRPASMAAVGFYSKPENRTRSLGLIRLAINLGFGIGPAFGGLIAAAFGYEWIFLIDGVTCMSAAILFILILEEKHRPQRKVSPAGESALDIPLPEIVRSPYRDAPFLLFLLFTFLNSVAFVQFMGTLPLFWKEEFGFGANHIGMLLAMNGFLIVIIEMPLIFVLEKKNIAMSLIAAGMLLVGLSYEVLTWHTWAGIAVISMLLLTVGEIINFPFSASYSLGRAHESNRGKYMGLYGLTFSVAHIIAPVMGMKVVDAFGYATLWHGLMLLCLFSAAGAMYVNHLMRKEEASKVRV